MVNFWEVKFLIDECLSPSLADLAVENGYVQSAHVVRQGMKSSGDPSITERALDEDWTVVTQNADDFRPPFGSKSERPTYVGVGLHAGLVCLNLPHNSIRTVQLRYFQYVLEYIKTLDSLINVIVEVEPDSKNPDVLMLRDFDYPETS